MDINLKNAYLNILKEELVPAMGCTEPIAIAYAGAKARMVLGGLPDKVIARCSGNIIKNARCVTIPNSGDLTGIEAGVMVGIVGGDADKKMEVLQGVDEDDVKKTKELLRAGICNVEFLDSTIPLHIIVELFKGKERALVEIKYSHTNITRIEKNDELLLWEIEDEKWTQDVQDRGMLSLVGIKDFADKVPIEEIKELFDKQIKCNMGISEVGMNGEYGLGIGKIIMDSYPESIITKMKACTSAASEARMGGCDLPVVINSGSGNQGIASSVPVIVYAREKGISDEKLYRTLAFSNLLTIYQKEFIGKLSAFCGAVSAACASGAAITYIDGGDLEQIKKTIVNTLANISGIICDGAKVSCAAKIASSLDASMMAHFLAMNGKVYEPYTGIVQGETEETISCVGYIGKEGMRETDKEIIKIMLGE